MEPFVIALQGPHSNCKVTGQKDIFGCGSIVKDIRGFRSKSIDEFLV